MTDNRDWGTMAEPLLSSRALIGCASEILAFSRSLAAAFERMPRLQGQERLLHQLGSARGPPREFFNANKRAGVIENLA
jgi:hypothetical protein